MKHSKDRKKRISEGMKRYYALKQPALTLQQELECRDTLINFLHERVAELERSNRIDFLLDCVYGIAIFWLLIKVII